MNKITRLITKIDVKGPNVIKSIQYDGYRVLNKAVDLAEVYMSEGADEIIYSDSIASLFNVSYKLEIIKNIASKLTIPFVVAGGIKTTKDIYTILRSGADKVVINTSAVNNPELIEEASKMFGAQCIVVAIDAFKNEHGEYEVWTESGHHRTGKRALDWAKQATDLGAGEILLSSINHDGLGLGYDLNLIKHVSTQISIPVIASGGVGKVLDFVDGIKLGNADALCAGSIFHYFYSKPVDREWMSYEENKLRMGREIDSGNIDFLKTGYGGLRDLFVQPSSIKLSKETLIKNNIEVRL